MVRTLIEAGAHVDRKMDSGVTLVEWVKESQAGLQAATFGDSWRQAHEDNLRLLTGSAKIETH